MSKRHWLLGLAAVALVTEIIRPQSEVRAFAKERYQDLQLFAKVLNLVQQYYVEEVDTQKLIYGGIKGMLRELDPHTNFLPPDLYKEFESETQGEFGGIGVEITVQKGVLTVISPIEDTPAWNAGIKAGDKIVEINGQSTKGMSLAEAAQLMKGKRGSKVRMGIFREGFEQPKEFVVVRGVVKIKSVKVTDMQEGIGYIRVTSFIENTARDVEKALADLNSKYKGIKGVIIDLRRNPGGLLDQAVKLSDLFLNEGVIVSTVSRNKRDKEVLSAKRAGTLPDFPMVLIIDEYSASASEIFAGALKDNKRALVMGQRSFGKGSVQSVVPLGDGSGLKLTVARYFTPSGRSIQAEGIMPDVILDDYNADTLDQARRKEGARREKDIQGHLLGEAEQEERERAAKEPAGRAGDAGGNPFWWSGNEDKKSKKQPSPKEKLLNEDYQALQAYNYLKAWVTMASLKGAVEVPPVTAPPAPAAAPSEAPKTETPKKPNGP